MKINILFYISLLLLPIKLCLAQAPGNNNTLVVKFTDDFQITGAGDNPFWKSAEWNILPQRKGIESQETRFKVLYSKTGIYFVFANEDKVLTASKNQDFDELWLEDVNEVFLWPDTTQTIYFEYEVSPLNYELPILVPNIQGKQKGWMPWQYTGARRIQHLTTVDGKKESGASIKGWTSEFFIPYALLTPLSNVPPQRGTVWRANMYRVDYDNRDQPSVWSWQKIQKNFHDFKLFGRLVFE